MKRQANPVKLGHVLELFAKLVRPERLIESPWLRIRAWFKEHVPDAWLKERVPSVRINDTFDGSVMCCRWFGCCVGRVLAMCYRSFGDVLAMCWQCGGDVLAKWYVGDVLADRYPRILPHGTAIAWNIAQARTVRKRLINGSGPNLIASRRRAPFSFINLSPSLYIYKDK